MSYIRRFRTSRARVMKRIGFTVFPGYQLMGLAALSVFEFTNLQRREPAYEVHLLSESGGPIRTSMGFPIETEPFGESEFDTLIVGGALAIAPSTPGLLDLLRRASTGTRRI